MRKRPRSLYSFSLLLNNFRPEWNTAFQLIPPTFATTLNHKCIENRYKEYKKKRLWQINYQELIVHPIRQRFNVKKTIIGVIVLLIGLCHLPEAILLIMDGISLDSILYLIGNILLCLLGIYQLKFRSREMRYLPTKSVIKEKNYSFNLKYLEPLKEMIESGNFSNNINIEKGTGGNLRLDVLMSADKKFAAVRLLQFIPYSYIPVMDMQYLRNDKIAALENFLEHSK